MSELYKEFLSFVVNKWNYLLSTSLGGIVCATTRIRAPPPCATKRRSPRIIGNNRPFVCMSMCLRLFAPGNESKSNLKRDSHIDEVPINMEYGISAVSRSVIVQLGSQLWIVRLRSRFLQFPRKCLVHLWRVPEISDKGRWSSDPIWI